MEKYYAKFFYPGAIVSETSTIEITKEQFEKPETITIPKGAHGFRVMKREETTVNGELLKGAMKNESVWYYVGEKLSKEDVAKGYGVDSTLYRNMSNNGYDHVVKTEFGQAFPLHKGDRVL
jgi:hypothetical protein